MPELPEVETIRRQMTSELAGKKIRKIVIRFSGRIRPSAGALALALNGADILSIKRRAKLLILNFSGGWTLVTHLKMTGKFLLKPRGALPGNHTHVIFQLSNAQDLWFDDVRKFGYLKLVRTEDLESEIIGPERYGPEPLEPTFTEKLFGNCLASRGKKKIKPLLMDQTCVAGIGNIYADEACFRAGIRPTRRVNSLSLKEFKALYRGILGALKDSLKYHGASASDYLDLYGKKGQTVQHLFVYGRKQCRRCRGALKKIRLGSRSAHFC